MPVKRYDGTNWVVVAGDGAAGAPGTNGTNGSSGAGVNKILNSDFNIWQRGTSFNLSSSGFTADRFQAIFDGSGSTRTYSRQAFTPGTAPVAGYEGSHFWRLAQTVAGTGGSFSVVAQLIENVRTFAGQTITFSFWAKADASRSITANVIQNFGSGGSSEIFAGSFTPTVSTSWVRYSGTITMPSISGKTIGTNSFVKVELSFPVNTAMTIDTWGWQVEAGSTATTFQTATGTLTGELAACQRYYAKTYTVSQAPATVTADGVLTLKSGNTDSFQHFASWRFPVEMRGTPTVTLYSPNTGASGKIYIGTSDVNATSSGYIGLTGTSPYVNNVSVGASTLLTVHVVAEAEL